MITGCKTLFTLLQGTEKPMFDGEKDVLEVD
jgi:hypothetical protein